MSGMADVREFDAEAAAMGAIRAYVQDALLRHGAGDEAIDAATLCVSELATNALLHGAGPIGVDLDLDLIERARVTVHDRNPDLPVVRRQAVDDDAGRGLLIVSMFADAWGTVPDEHGKVVWFEIDLRERPEVRHEVVTERRRGGGSRLQSRSSQAW
jgi:anti-sigma regulatory factor (Ser/Thr protein kinase)